MMRRVTDLSIVELLEQTGEQFPYAAPNGRMREADDVKPGLICPHQEQNSHHLLGHSMHLVGIHPSAGTGYPIVHAAEIKAIGFLRGA